MNGWVMCETAMKPLKFYGRTNVESLGKKSDQWGMNLRAWKRSCHPQWLHVWTHLRHTPHFFIHSDWKQSSGFSLPVMHTYLRSGAKRYGTFRMRELKREDPYAVKTVHRNVRNVPHIYLHACVCLWLLVSLTQWHNLTAIRLRMTAVCESFMN